MRVGGAVVGKDAEPWAGVGGNPAEFIKKQVLKACRLT